MSTRINRKTSSRSDLKGIQKALDANYSDRRWLRMLELFLPTGAADVLQLRRSIGLSRDQVNRLLARFEKLAPDRLLVRVPFNVPRPGVRGRPPVVYTLGDLGAALLRANGHPNAHACGLTDATAIAHAQVTLNVRLVALAAGLDVQTERELAYGDGQVLRPDNLVTLPGGIRALFETEQAVDLTLLRRIVDSIRRKTAFFQSKAGRRVSSTVRVLVNLPPGRKWDRTMQVWERATAIAAEENGGRLQFRLWAIPLRAFLEQPDWDDPPGRDRWEPLFDPAQTSTFAPAQPPPEKGRAKALTQRRTRLPRGLSRRSAHDDRLILLAFWQVFQEQAPTLGKDRSRPDPVFFDVMRIIYTASSDPHADILTQRFDYFHLVLEARGVPADELLTANLRVASAARPEPEQTEFLIETGYELVWLLTGDILRLEYCYGRCGRTPTPCYHLCYTVSRGRGRSAGPETPICGGLAKRNSHICRFRSSPDDPTVLYSHIHPAPTVLISLPTEIMITKSVYGGNNV